MRGSCHRWEKLCSVCCLVKEIPHRSVKGQTVRALMSFPFCRYEYLPSTWRAACQNNNKKFHDHTVACSYTCRYWATLPIVRKQGKSKAKLLEGKRKAKEPVEGQRMNWKMCVQTVSREEGSMSMQNVLALLITHKNDPHSCELQAV